MGRKGQPFREKGQNLIEYALLLAIIVGMLAGGLMALRRA